MNADADLVQEAVATVAVERAARVRIATASIAGCSHRHASVPRRALRFNTGLWTVNAAEFVDNRSDA